MEAVVEMCKYLTGKYPIKHIYGHRAFAKTDCPGNKFPLEEIISEVFNDSKANAPYPGYLIKKNNNKYDENIVRIQKRLMQLGYDVGGGCLGKYILIRNVDY